MEQDEQPEQSEDSSGWNLTTSRMVIEFYKENRVLWDRNHKGCGEKIYSKEAFTPLVAKLKRSNVPKSESEIKERWHNLLTPALRNSRKQSLGKKWKNGLIGTICLLFAMC